MSEKSDKKAVKSRRSVSYFTLGASIVAAILVGFIVGTRYNDIYLSDNSLTPLKETYKALQENYDGKLDEKKLIEGASRGMVQAVGDPYTVFLDKKEAAEFASDLDGTFSGIGAELGKKKDKLVVISALDASPAQKAGLKPNDVIAAVNDNETTGWSVDKAVSKIRGEKGTIVKLTLVRDGDPIEVSIKRATITDPSVKTEEKGDVGIIRIARFGDETASLTRKAAEQFADKRAIVVDLRGNGGGYLQSSKEIASLWLNNGQVVVSERSGGSTNETLKAEGDNVLQGKPTVVLVDQGSASASEILAGALQDHKVAKIVGEKTFGKGSVQDVVSLRNGAQLKVTIARWYTPNGKNISKQGITPDVVIVAGEDDDHDNDTQLNKALELLK